MLELFTNELMKKTTSSPASSRFSKESIDFLKLAEVQTSESWLDKNKSLHERVIVEPLKELAAYLTTHIAGRPEARGFKFPRRGFGRIRRPSFKIGPGEPAYRNWVHLSASRPSVSRFDDNPGLYFYFSSDRIFSGGGLYAPSYRQIKQMRAVFALDASEFETLFKSRSFKKQFPRGFEMDKVLKTFPRDYPNDHERINLLRLQAFYVKRDYTKKEFYSKDFRDLVLENWKETLKLSELLTESLKTDLWEAGARSPVVDEQVSDDEEDSRAVGTRADLWDDRL